MNTTMPISELGEFGLIDRIARLLPSAAGDVVVGIGDDVAVLDTAGPHYLLATCDVQVENVHFLRHTISPQQLGGKVMAINVSDIAAMGGRPKWALVSLALPDNLEVDFVDEFYRGLNYQAQTAGVAIVGGNLARIDGPMVIDLFLLGECDKECFLRRNGAQVGDAILVTGTLGDSRAGLELLQQPHLQVPIEVRAIVLAAHHTPQPRLIEGQLLAACGRVHAMLDVSDGLLSDLGHICQASQVGASVELAQVPLSPACREVARAAGVRAAHWALTGGEDYQLLFTTAPANVADVQTLLAVRTGIVAEVIGHIRPAAAGITVVTTDGTVEATPPHSGWDHFPKAPSP
jgi:thiamine-monophosphate kinase